MTEPEDKESRYSVVFEGKTIGRITSISEATEGITLLAELEYERRGTPMDLVPSEPIEFNLHFTRTEVNWGRLLDLFNESLDERLELSLWLKDRSIFNERFWSQHQ